MLNKLYLAGLSTLLLTALGGLVYCAALIARENPAGLANIGKLLLVATYSAYRLRSLLNHCYQVYRPWESARTRNTKRILIGGIAPCLCLVVGTGIGLAMGWSMAAFVLPASLLALLAIFIGIEALNALDGNLASP